MPRLEGVDRPTSFIIFAKSPQLPGATFLFTDPDSENDNGNHVLIGGLIGGEGKKGGVSMLLFRNLRWQKCFNKSSR